MAIDLDQRPDLVILRFSGEVSARDLAEGAERLDQIDRSVPGLPRLVHATGITGITLNFAAVIQFADDRERRSLAREVKTAILAESNVTFGFARMYQDLLRNPQIAVEVFRNRDEALAWLGVDPGIGV